MKKQLCDTHIPQCAPECHSKTHPADSDLIKMHRREQLNEFSSKKKTKIDQRNGIKNTCFCQQDSKSQTSSAFAVCGTFFKKINVKCFCAIICLVLQ